MGNKYIDARPYLVNIFQKGLRFDQRSFQAFFEQRLELVKTAEQFVDSYGGSFVDEPLSLNPITKLYGVERATSGSSS